MVNLCNYIENNWLRSIGADKISIFGLTNGINNHVQTFNKELRNQLGSGSQTNLTIWHLLESLTTVATKTYVKLSKKKKFGSHCQPQQQPQRKGRIVVDTIINNATQLWIRTAVHLRSPLQFLQLCSHCIQDINNFSGIIDDGKSNSGITIASSTPNSSLTPNDHSSSYSLTSSQQQYSIQTNIGGQSNNPFNQYQSTQQFYSNSNNNSNYQVQQIQSQIVQPTYKISSDPPPLAFFPKVRRIYRSEPPPLVPIGSKR